jgi:hypothetical protein
LYLRFDVAMKYTVLMHVVDRLDDLVHVKLYSLFRQVVSTSFNCFVHVHVHKFKYKGKAASWFIVQHFVQSNDVWMRGQSF